MTDSPHPGQTHIDLIEEGFSSVGHPEPPRACMDALARYLDDLALWSRRFRITGFSTPRERVEQGVLDCLPLADAIAHGASVVDVGSGAGLPGLPLALLRPDASVLLLEPSSRRTAFLRTEVHSLPVTNARVLRSRVEDIGEILFDAAVSRAVFKPRIWLEIAPRLVRPGGTIFVLIGSGEVPPAPPGLETISSTPYVLPWSRSPRTIVAVACPDRRGVA